VTPEDLNALRYIARRRAHDHSLVSPYDGYTNDLRRAHRLVRTGYLKRTQHSEHVRGEDRLRWWVFDLTEQGKQAIGDA
jgi:hypothetical protein